VSSRSGGAVVIGIGNTWRGDDGVGWRVAERLDELMGDEVEVVQLDGEPARLIEAWDGARIALVVDGVRLGIAVGTVVLLSTEEVPPDQVGASTHAMGLSYAVRLGEALGRMPTELVVVGVEVGDVTVGHHLTPEVAVAIEAAVTKAIGVLNARWGAHTAVRGGDEPPPS
jgi:hydrogenase maturation protease